MKQLLIIALATALNLGCNGTNNQQTQTSDKEKTQTEQQINPQSEATFQRNPKKIIQDKEISVELYDFENIKPFLNQKNDKIYVVNFWATWCVPCVAELPYFEQLKENYPEIELLLISLDFPKMINSNLIPFIRKNNLKGEVVVLDEPNGNKWIPQINKDWSGAIPATLIYQNQREEFYEQSFTYQELEETVLNFKNQK